MQAKRRRLRVGLEALITQPGGDSICPAERDEQVAFGVAKAGSRLQNIRCSTRDRIELKVQTVGDLIAHTHETPAGDLGVRIMAKGEMLGQRMNVVVSPVDNRRGAEIGLNRVHRSPSSTTTSYGGC